MGRGRGRGRGAGAAAGAVGLGEFLGYGLGAASVLLYAPVGLRVARQGRRGAEGLAVSTWWLKVSGFTASVLYNQSNGYPIEQYSETLVLALESAAVLALVSYYRGEEDGFDARFVSGLAALGGAAYLGATAAPPEALALAQAGATAVQISALLPQVALNAERRACSYSPVTSTMAVLGCTVRVYTTLQLAGGDRLLLAGFGAGFLLNSILLGQALYYGTVVQGTSLREIFTADFSEAPERERASKGALQE